MVIQQGQKAQHQLNGAVGNAQGHDLLQLAQVGLEFPEAQVGLPGQKIPQEEEQAAQLGQSRGQGRAKDAPVPDHDEEIVQPHVDEEADAHAEHGQVGGTVHLHHDLQAVGQDEAEGEQTDHMQILCAVPNGLRPGPQEGGQRLSQDRNGDGDQHRQHDDDRRSLGKDPLRPVVLPLTQRERAEGGGPHREQDGDAGEKVDKRQGDVDAGQGQVADTLGDEDAVHDGVRRKQQHGRHRGQNVVQKGFPGMAGGRHDIHLKLVSHADAPLRVGGFFGILRIKDGVTPESRGFCNFFEKEPWHGKAHLQNGGVRRPVRGQERHPAALRPHRPLKAPAGGGERLPLLFCPPAAHL